MTKTNEEWVEEFQNKDHIITSDGGLYVAIDAHWLRTLLQEKDKEREEAVAKYQELLMAVEFKHEGETRHQTALRYIQQTELPHLIGVTAYQSELDQPDALTK